jgi:CheY-like chemotaxis protein/phosphoribosyl 1,2-cyclic phosphodiesterase
MRVRFWGTRGSLAKPGPKTLRYGGNTSCVEVEADDGTVVVLDCGTGAHELGQSLLAAGKTRGHLFISHTHWDHIQGLPFFAPLYVPGAEWDVYGPGGLGLQLEQLLAGQQEYRYFPVTMAALNATIRFHDLAEGELLAGGIHVTACYLNHPAVTLGYRLRAGKAEVVYATDHEPHWIHPAEDGADAVGIHHEDQRHVDFMSGAGLVIHDAQYRLTDFPAKAGWGHTPAEEAVDYCMAAGVKQLALFHHDPLRDDEQVDRLVERCSLRAAASPLRIFAAAEGQEVILSEGRRAAVPEPERLQPFVAPVTPEAETVLVVDDDADIVNLIAESLADDGFHVVGATTGEEALRLARDSRPDMILLDWLLPGPDGLEICRRLRQSDDPAARRVPIVIMTGRSAGEDVARGFEAGASDYLVKPFTPAYIRSRVRDWLLRQSDGREVVEQVAPETICPVEPPSLTTSRF